MDCLVFKQSVPSQHLCGLRELFPDLSTCLTTGSGESRRHPGAKKITDNLPAAGPVYRPQKAHMSSTPNRHLGLIGLGVMGENLALNFERNGFSVCGFDLDAGKRQQFKARTQGLQASVADSLPSLVGSLQLPRRILLMVPAGRAVDAVLAELRKQLARDRVKTQAGGFSSLGLLEMTRKRTHEDLIRYLTEACSSCDGRGYHKSRRTICFEIFREILREARAYDAANGYMVIANQKIIDRLLSEESAAVADLELFIAKPIRFQVESLYTQEQYDIVLL